MPFCTQCRTAVAETDKYCPSCGAEVNRAAPSPSPGGPTPSGASAPTLASASLSPNGASVLCYVFGFVSGIILLNVEPWARDRTVRFHAFQAIFFSIACAVAGVVVGVLAVALFFAIGPAVGLLQVLYWAGSLALWIVLMVKAYKGDRLMLPVFGRWAERAADGPSSK